MGLRLTLKVFFVNVIENNALKRRNQEPMWPPSLHTVILGHVSRRLRSNVIHVTFVNYVAIIHSKSQTISRFRNSAIQDGKRKTIS